MWGNYIFFHILFLKDGFFGHNYQLYSPYVYVCKNVSWKGSEPDMHHASLRS